MNDAVDNAIDDRLAEYREALFDLLRQPSVSTTGEGMVAAGELVVETLERLGLSADSIETDRYPLVYAERESPGGDPAETPTIVFYGHYDVQPPGDLDAWDSPPFDPTVRDGSIYARGAGDNKGQFACHAFAVDALLAADAFPDVTVKLLIEGGEESGSHGLRAYLDADAEGIGDADLIYVADGPQHAVSSETESEAGDTSTGTERRSTPTIVYGNRGVLSFQVDHRTADTDLHSGNFGGPVPAATNELVAALASMRDGDEITVEGFHDGIEITSADRELCEAIPDDSRAIADDLDLSHLATERPYYERLLLEPTMTINGLDGGYRGDGTKTVLPATASAKLDCRLVPDQDPGAVFEAVVSHLTDVNPDLTVRKQGTFPPMKTPAETPAADPVERALASVWDESPVELPILGGSLPAAYFRRADALSDVPIIVVPYANHDQGNHSPNEHLSLRHFENGVRTSARVIREIERLDAYRYSS